VGQQDETCDVSVETRQTSQRPTSQPSVFFGNLAPGVSRQQHSSGRTDTLNSFPESTTSSRDILPTYADLRIIMSVGSMTAGGRVIRQGLRAARSAGCTLNTEMLGQQQPQHAVLQASLAARVQQINFTIR